MLKPLLQVLSSVLLIIALIYVIKALDTWSCIEHTVNSEKVTPGNKRPPHIVFIFADDLGHDDIGYHARGHGSAAKTPHLDRLAMEGVKLENYYVQPACTPSRSQLLSGRYQIHTGLQHDVILPPQPNSLPLDEVTLPEALRANGYDTRMVGKWNIGMYKEACLPTERGFNEFLGYLQEQGDYYRHNSSFPVYGNTFNGYDFFHNKEPRFDYVGQYSTNIFTQKATETIMAHNQSKPLFLYVAYQAIHLPLQVPPQYTEPFLNITDESRRAYLGDLLCMDEGVHNVTKALKASGMYNDTIIIFSTDNGGGSSEGASNWPLRGNKTTLWEGGIRGIGFVHSPLLNDSVKGTINREFIHVSDWLPTLVAGIAGGSLNGTKPLDGFNVWDTIKHGAPSPRKEILHNIDPFILAPYSRYWTTPADDWTIELDKHLATIEKFGNFNSRIEAALRVGDWKLKTGLKDWGDWVPPPESAFELIEPHNYPNQTVWLFNITADPLEMNDLSLQRPDVVEKLLVRMNEYYQDSVPVSFPLPDLESNPALHGGVWLPWY